MVETIFIDKILKQLEKYLIRKNNYRLTGDNYGLILLEPSDKYISDTKYSLLISAKKLNGLSQKDVIKELLVDFKVVLKLEEYNALSRLNIIHSEDPLVKNLSFMLGQHREEIIEINDMTIGGVKIDFAYLVKSLVLDKLIEGKAITIELINGQRINAGIIRIDENFDIVHYTGKGLSEIWKPDMTDEERENAEKLKTKPEEFLMQHQFVAKMPLDDIARVVE